MKLLSKICLLVFILHSFGCSNTSPFDIEYEKTKSQLDSVSALLLERNNNFNTDNLHSVCLFKTINTNCNFEQEGLPHFAMGLASITNDTIVANFGLPFGNYSLSIKSIGNSTKLEFKEFYAQSEQVLKYKATNEFYHSLTIPIEFQTIEYEHKIIEKNYYEIWGKLRTNKFIKMNLLNKEEVNNDCIWDVEFLAKINLNEY